MTQPGSLFEEFGVSEAELLARGLRPCTEADGLELADVGSDGREHLLIPAAAAAWRSMKSAADDDGVEMFIVSAFRSVERQAEIVRQKLGSGHSIGDVLQVSAFPGFSEHHSGRALDLGAPGVPLLEVEFEQSPAFEWLTGHARQFGFQLSYPPDNPLGYQYEPWHWCYRDNS